MTLRIIWFSMSKLFLRLSQFVSMWLWNCNSKLTIQPKNNLYTKSHGWHNLCPCAKTLRHPAGGGSGRARMTRPASLPVLSQSCQCSPGDCQQREPMLCTLVHNNSRHTLDSRLKNIKHGQATNNNHVQNKYKLMDGSERYLTLSSVFYISYLLFLILCPLGLASRHKGDDGSPQENGWSKEKKLFPFWSEFTQNREIILSFDLHGLIFPCWNQLAHDARKIRTASKQVVTHSCYSIYITVLPA